MLKKLSKDENFGKKYYRVKLSHTSQEINTPDGKKPITVLLVNCQKDVNGIESCNCPGNERHTVCYHGLGALYRSFKDSGKLISFFETYQSAVRMAFNGKIVKVKSANGNGFVWAMPVDAEFPDPEKCPRLKNVFLEPPKPPAALDDYMDAIDGDFLKFSKNFSMLVSGPSKAGKSVFVSKFVRHVHELMNEVPAEIIWCYSEFQPAYLQLQAAVPNLQLIEGLPNIQSLKQDTARHKLIVFDDMMDRFESVVRKVLDRNLSM